MTLSDQKSHETEEWRGFREAHAPRYPYRAQKWGSYRAHGLFKKRENLYVARVPRGSHPLWGKVVLGKSERVICPPPFRGGLWPTNPAQFYPVVEHKISERKSRLWNTKLRVKNRPKEGVGEEAGRKRFRLKTEK